MNKNIFLAVIFSLFCLTIADAQTLRGTIGKGVVRRGAAAKATVILDIPDGIHTNSSRPKSEYLIPTRLKVSGARLKIGTVMYPRGTDKKFEFSEEPLNVYEHRAAFNFIVAVPKTYRGEAIKVLATINYQACTNEVCYPPKKLEITLTAKVK